VRLGERGRRFAAGLRAKGSRLPDGIAGARRGRTFGGSDVEQERAYGARVAGVRAVHRSMTRIKT
jgi:hypothetical protein